MERQCWLVTFSPGLRPAALTDEDDIRELCAKAAAATDEEAKVILAELRAALQAHINDVRADIRHLFLVSYLSQK